MTVPLYEADGKTPRIAADGKPLTMEMEFVRILIAGDGLCEASAPVDAAIKDRLVGSSGVVSAAAATATLANAAGRTAYLSGFSVSGLGATATAMGGTINFAYPVPAGVGVAGPPISVPFVPPMPASAVNTNIVITVASFGSGNTDAAVMAQGYLQPSGDPDAPRGRPKGDLGVYVSDGDVRAAVRQSRGERLPGRRAPELTLENLSLLPMGRPKAREAPEKPVQSWRISSADRSRQDRAPPVFGLARRETPA